jgi:hypothetical protein
MEERLIAMVPTPAGAVLSAADVARAIPQFAGPLGAANMIEPDNAGANSFIVSLGGVSVAVVMMGFPIPDETLARALHFELVWREATTVLKQATGHVLLAVVEPPTDPRQLLKQARALTAVTAAVLSVTSGLGVFWSPADYLIPPDRFAQEAEEQRASDFACSLWFSFRLLPGTSDGNDNSFVCQSTGLEIFLGREVECGPYRMAPLDLVQTVMFVTRYMATAGPIFGDGHTLGFGEGKHSQDARLKLTTSQRLGPERPVFRLELLAQEATAR